MEERKMVEVEVNAFQLTISKIMTPGTIVSAPNMTPSLMPSPTFIIENDHHAERILRGFVHSGYEVSVREIRIKKMVPEECYGEKCCSEYPSTSVASQGMGGC